MEPKPPAELPAPLVEVQATFVKAITPPSVGSWRRSLCAWSAWTRLAGGGTKKGACTPGKDGAMPSGRTT